MSTAWRRTWQGLSHSLPQSDVRQLVTNNGPQRKLTNTGLLPSLGTDC